jgi:catechol 2,3-dioxygenase-like lactoylglutathione lyase family enzyme
MLGSSDVCATIAVRDLGAAQKFYGEVLGLEQSMESPGGVFYKSGNSGVFVYPTEFAGTNKATYASWMVDDVEAAVEALKAKNVNFLQYDNIPGGTREGDIHVMGELKAAWFTDPDGNILNIVNQMG